MTISPRQLHRGGVLHWYVSVSVHLPDGSWFRKRDLKPPHNTKAAAMRYGEAVRDSVLAGKYGKAPPTLETFSTDFMKWSETHNRQSSVAAKKSTLKLHILPGLGSKRLDEIKAQELSGFVAGLQKKKLSTKSVYNVLAVLRKMLRLAEEWEMLDRAPKIKSPKLQPPPFRFLELDETREFLAAAAYWPDRLLFVRTALETGMRSGELRALKWHDIDIRRAIVTVQRSRWRNLESGTKAYRPRDVPLAADLLDVLKAARHLKSDYVFCHADGTPWSASEVKDWVPAICRRAGLKRLTLHGLRHSYASQLTMLGEGSKTVQELLGHGSGVMTARYTHLTPDFKRSAVEKLSTAIHGETKKEKANED